MKLPAALESWQPWLGALDPELAIALGELLVRLDRLIGRPHGSRHRGEPEPDGLGNLARRGPYERLLGTEWLLAEEIPDEFLRRAATGEHLFLAPRPRLKKRGGNIIAVFDAGPMQLGAPRLVHLAMAILLARRAVQVGAILRIGSTHRPGELTTDFEEKTLRALLATRTHNLATETHARMWSDWMIANADDNHENWLIAHPAEFGQPAVRSYTHRLAIARGTDGEHLDLAYESRAGRRMLALGLPGSDAAVRLLKGDFAARPAISSSAHQRNPHRFALTHAPLIGPDGRLIAVPALDRPALLTFSVPQQSGQRVKVRELRYSGDFSPLGFALIGKRALGLMASAQRLHCWQSSRLHAIPRPGDMLRMPPGTARHLGMAFLHNKQGEKMYVLDTTGELLGFSADKTKQFGATASRVASDVVAICQVNSQKLLYAQREGGDLHVRSQLWTGSETWPAFGPAPQDCKVLFDASEGWHSLPGPIAIGTDHNGTEQWRVYAQSGNTRSDLAREDFTLQAGWRAIGMRAHLTQHAPTATLVLISPARDRLTRITRGGSEELFRADSPIKQCTMCPTSGLIALLTERRQLICLSATTGEIRFTLDHDAQSQ